MSDPHEREPIDQATIDCWRVNYGLDKMTPAKAMTWWANENGGKAPAGAVAALGLVLDELDALRKDAERYRFLRAVYNIPISTQAARDPVVYDAAIDAAMQRAASGT